MSAAVAVEKKIPESIKRAVYLREMLNNNNRNFAYGKRAEHSYKKIFVPVEHDIRLMRFASDHIGALSDCFILYAVSMMGVSTIENIILFLKALAEKNKDLSLPNIKDYELIKRRVESLIKNGFLFKHHYEVAIENEAGDKMVKKVNLFSIEKSGLQLINQRLGSKVVINDWMDAKPLNELMGWGACGYVQGRVASSGKFIEHKQGLFRTKAFGTALFPGELRMQQKNGESVSVGFVQGFMRHNKAAQTVEQYEDSCFKMINMIKQYFYMKDVVKKVNSCMVIVVEDNPDLMAVADFIHKTKALVDDYDRIYFTGEGVIRAAQSAKEVKEGFLQLRAVSEKEVDFVPCEPVFIS